MTIGMELDRERERDRKQCVVLAVGDGTSFIVYMVYKIKKATQVAGPDTTRVRG